MLICIGQKGYDIVDLKYEVGDRLVGSAPPVIGASIGTV